MARTFAAALGILGADRMPERSHLDEAAVTLTAKLGHPIFVGAGWDTALDGRAGQLEQLAHKTSQVLGQLASEEPGRDSLRARLQAVWLALGPDSVMHLAPDGLLTVVESKDPAHLFTEAQLREGIETLLQPTGV